MSSKGSANEQTGRRLDSKLSHASYEIDRKSDDVYAHVAGALYRVFLTLAVQATRAYLIFVIKLFVWSIVPLVTVVAVLLQLAPLSPAMIIVCYGAIAVIIWTVLTLLNRSMRPADDVEVEALTEEPLKVSSATRLGFFASVRVIISALTSLIKDFFKGRIKPLFTLGLLIRIVGLGGFLYLSYAGEFLGQSASEKLIWLKNELYWLEYGLFDAIVAQPILNVVEFVTTTANSFGFDF